MRNCRVFSCAARFADIQHSHARCVIRCIGPHAPGPARLSRGLEPPGRGGFAASGPVNSYMYMCLRVCVLVGQLTTLCSHLSGSLSYSSEASRRAEVLGSEAVEQSEQESSSARPSDRDRVAPVTFHGFEDGKTGQPTPVTFVRSEAEQPRASPAPRIRKVQHRPPPPGPLPTFRLGDRYRNAMRRVGHSVVVCTTVRPAAAAGPGGGGGGSGTGKEEGGETKEAEPRGMTLSSLTSLSLHPSPAVTFNIACPSRTLEALEASRLFNLHVLTGTREGALVAHRFSNSGVVVRSPFLRLGAIGVRVLYGQTDGSASGTRPSRQGQGPGQGQGQIQPPVLQGRGISYTLRCKLMDDKPHRGLIAVRDHVVVLGDVLEVMVGVPETEDFGHAPDNIGLLYGNQQYRQIGPVVFEGRRTTKEERQRPAEVRRNLDTDA
jgi:hypothetical protein